MKLNFWMQLEVYECNKYLLVALSQYDQACLNIPKLMTSS